MSDICQERKINYRTTNKSNYIFLQYAARENVLLSWSGHGPCAR